MTAWSNDVYYTDEHVTFIHLEIDHNYESDSWHATIFWGFYFWLISFALPKMSGSPKAGQKKTSTGTPPNDATYAISPLKSKWRVIS